MRLYIVRHGEAEPRAPTDAERHLTARGRAAVEMLWYNLANEGLLPAKLVASPYARARQTADCIAHQFPGVDRRICDLLVPDGSAEAVLAWLAEQGNISDWVLVSHMPLVAALTGLMTEGLGSRGAFGVGTVACLDVEVLAPAGSRLLWQRGPG